MKRILIIILMAYPLILFSQESTLNIMKAKALGERDNYEEAIKILSDPAMGVDNVRAIIELGNIYRRQGKFKEALTEYKRAESFSRGSASLDIARTYSLDGDYKSAVEWMRLHLRSEYRKSEKELMTDKYLTSLSGRSEWKDLWKTEYYSDSEKSRVEADYYIRLGMIDDASSILKEIERTAGENSDYLIVAAKIQLYRKDYKAALALLSRIESVMGIEEEVMRLKGECEMGEGNYPMAISTYTEMMKKGYGDASILILRSKAFVKMGDVTRGINDLEYYLECYPGDTGASNTLSQLYSSVGDFYKSLALLSENIRNRPGDAEGYRNRAEVYMKSGSYDGAFADLSMSLDLDPGNANAWLNTGLALIKAGKAEQACHYLKKAGEMGLREASSLLNKYCNR